MKNIHWAIIYIVAAILYYILSGAAEGMTSPRVLLSLVFLASLAHFIIVSIQIIQSIFIRSYSVGLGHFAVLAGLVAVVIGFKLGNDVDKLRIAESMKRGDELITEIRDFKNEESRCPVDLEELKRRGIIIPEPALKGSRYRYWVSGSGQCNISFDSVLFMSCKKSTNDEDWYCDD